MELEPVSSVLVLSTRPWLSGDSTSGFALKHNFGNYNVSCVVERRRNMVVDLDF